MKQRNGLEALPEDVLVNPDFYLYDLDLKSFEARFVLMNRECYRRSPFLDGRMSRASDVVCSISLHALMEHVESNLKNTRPAKYVFHHGACGSTLIARCLDIEGASLALREPIALHQLAVARRNINNSSVRGAATWLALDVFC